MKTSMVVQWAVTDKIQENDTFLLIRACWTNFRTAVSLYNNFYGLLKICSLFTFFPLAIASKTRVTWKRKSGLFMTYCLRFSSSLRNHYRFFLLHKFPFCLRIARYCSWKTQYLFSSLYCPINAACVCTLYR